MLLYLLVPLQELHLYKTPKLCLRPWGIKPYPHHRNEQFWVCLFFPTSSGDNERVLSKTPNKPWQCRSDSTCIKPQNKSWWFLFYCVPNVICHSHLLTSWVQTCMHQNFDQKHLELFFSIFCKLWILDKSPKSVAVLWHLHPHFDRAF